MCIICAKPAGVEMPSEKYIKNMWRRNDDGAGIMWTSNNKVHIKKGFMKYKHLKKFLKKLEEQYNITDLPLVMHFRITTHGGTKPQNCHPFPVVRKIEKLQALEYCTDLGVAHNGCIKIDNPPEISDTMAYISRNLVDFRTRNGMFYKNKETLKKIEKEITSKMCFLDNKGQMTFIGNFVEENGIKYSNSSYEGYDKYYEYSNYYSNYYGYGSSRYGWEDWESWEDHQNWQDSYFGYDEINTTHTKETQKELMEVDGYIYDSGEMIEGNIFIDSSQRAYIYDEKEDICKPVDGTIYTTYGTYATFNELKAVLMNVSSDKYKGNLRRSS